uniref:Uncharacterized protein n=1 Tax=Triticum urartu TaxID=4572 RepID=A0A8R7Q2A6_TRIUA
SPFSASFFSSLSRLASPAGVSLLSSLASSLYLRDSPAGVFSSRNWLPPWLRKVHRDMDEQMYKWIELQMQREPTNICPLVKLVFSVRKFIPFCSKLCQNNVSADSFCL